jgi:hypothetical protein
MKKFMITSILLAMFAGGAIIQAQGQREESLGLPGDNLNLYAVMKLFQESETLEGFERNLNDGKLKINNLDLNGDNYIDYIRVIDYADGNDHTIVLQVAVNERENQDVAVFTVQRDGNKVYVQLIGDQDLYGKDYIIEPVYDENGETANPGYAGNTHSGNNSNVTVIRTNGYEVAEWPMVRFIYLPTYVPWQSSWYYGHYPSYWQPWQPYYWDYYYGYHYNYYGNYYASYHRMNYHRYNGWNDHYWNGNRAHSTNVNIRITNGSYNTTYSRPDERKKGEADFLKVNPDQGRRGSGNSSGNNTERRTGSQSDTRRNAESTTISRQSSGTVTEKSGSNRNSGSNASKTRSTAPESSTRASSGNRPEQKTETRRSEPEVTTKASSGNRQEQKTETTRRSEPEVTTKASSGNRQEQKTETTRRSEPEVTTRSSSGNRPEQKTTTVRSSEKSTSTSSGSESRRNNESTKAAPPAKKSEKSNESASPASTPAKRR